ncbi:MAG TPA: hypothetical protein VK120_04115 [Sporosarcina sp.]|nr:hypothetical protein [Sporosarcina sp.]
MNAALIIAIIFVAIVLVIGSILTISAANSMNENYRSDKSFSSLLWVYILTIPFIIIVVIIAMFFFYR